MWANGFEIILERSIAASPSYQHSTSANNTTVLQMKCVFQLATWRVRFAQVRSCSLHRQVSIISSHSDARVVSVSEWRWWDLGAGFYYWYFTENQRLMKISGLYFCTCYREMENERMYVISCLATRVKRSIFTFRWGWSTIRVECSFGVCNNHECCHYEMKPRVKWQPLCSTKGEHTWHFMHRQLNFAMYKLHMKTTGKIGVLDVPSSILSIKIKVACRTENQPYAGQLCHRGYFK